MFASGKSASVSTVANYIEDVFSTYLYTGTGATQTITNGIDLAGNGGLVWTKSRVNAYNHALYDTVRGVNNRLNSNTTDAAGVAANTLTAFNSSGFTLGASDGGNYAAVEAVSWTFRKQPKFFDVVTFTQLGIASGFLTVNHSLGSTPGCIIIKRTSAAQNWLVYHKDTASQYLYLNLTDAAAAGVVCQNVTSTSFDFNLGAFGGSAGTTYVAYLFAHNDGGFGLTGTDNVISCGSYSGNSSSPPFVNLGWEPQFVMVKLASYAFASGGWHIFDNMRGMGVSSPWQNLSPNSSAAESAYGAGVIPTATGFKLYGNDFEVNTNDGGAATYIYIAIRRGPMKVPTDATKVFAPIASSASTNTQLTTNFPVDLQLLKVRNSGGGNLWFDRLRGTSTGSTSTSSPYLDSASTAAEVSGADLVHQWNNTGFSVAANWGNLPKSMVYENFRRAPSFFDEVCYTGATGVTSVAHNLGVAPELMIVVGRSASTGAWFVYSASLGNAQELFLNTTSAAAGTASWNSQTPTSTVFYKGATSGNTNTNGNTFVAYLFASCPGVSKVGSYIGNGTSKTIDCGFTAGARFVLIKRTDSTGDWYVWDTARGIVSGNDPHLRLNSAAVEVTTDDTIDTDSSGFVVNQDAATNVNVSSATYIYLAIA